MENFKACFIRLSSLLGFANSNLTNDLKNVELLINTDESSIQPIELKSQMMKALQVDDSEPLDNSMSALNSVVSHLSKLNSTQLLSSSKSNAEQPSSSAILVDLSAESVVCQNSKSTGHLPQPAFPHSIEVIRGSEASGNKEAETNKQMARENRHVLHQYEKHEKSPHMNSAVDSRITGTAGVVLIPDRSQTQTHQGLPESQVQQSCVAVPPCFSSTCLNQSVQSKKPLCTVILERSLRFYKDTMKPRYDLNAADKQKKVQEGFDAIISSGTLSCIDKECSYKGITDLDMLFHLHTNHGLIFNSATMTKKEIMQSIKPFGTKPTKYQGVPSGMRLCRFNYGECYNAYKSRVYLDAHIIEKHRELVEHLHPASDTHYCEVCWAIFAKDENLRTHKRSFNHFIDDFERSQMMKRGRGGKRKD